VNLKEGFSRFLETDPKRLHFAAHSHHPWPDVTLDAHMLAWQDAAALMDDKWVRVFETVLPSVRHRISRVLGLSDPGTIVLAPNTHELLVRLFSCFVPPVRILTTDAEFHSMTRQSLRWEEAGLATVERVPAEPFETFPDRFTAALRQGGHDLVYLSQVFYDSGYLVPGIDRLVSAISDQGSFVIVDGYHAFMALPVDLGAVQDRVFYLAGGYKYAMSGEGACFMHCPPGYGDRPVNTGWYAGFGQLESGPGGSVGYATDGSRFFGATFDPSGLYRMDAALGWLESVGASPQAISEHVKALQGQFLESAAHPGVLLPPTSSARGNFLTFQTPDAPDLYRRLHESGIITDYRRDRLRIGFGIYHDETDVARLVETLSSIH
jgi:kynureninase